jgi:hypothetical protein
MEVGVPTIVGRLFFSVGRFFRNLRLARRGEHLRLRGSARFYLRFVNRLDSWLEGIQRYGVWFADEIEDDQWERHGPVFHELVERSEDVDALEELHQTTMRIRRTQASGLKAATGGYVFAGRDYATLHGFRDDLAKGREVLERLLR